MGGKKTVMKQYTVKYVHFQRRHRRIASTITSTVFFIYILHVILFFVCTVAVFFFYCALC